MVRTPFIGPVWNIYRYRSRCGIKSCNPKNQIWGDTEKSWYLSRSGCGIKSGIHTTFVARTCGSGPCVFVRAESMPKAAKAGLARSHGDELVQRTLDGSAQRPSPKAHRARPSATVPAQANRRKKRKATGSAGEPPAAAARSPTAAAQGHSDRQPSATAAQDGGPGQLLIGNYHVGGPISWRHRSRLPRRWSSI